MTRDATAERAVEITIDGRLYGRGKWDGHNLTCDADVPDDVWICVEAGIRAGESRASIAGRTYRWTVE